MSFKAIYTVLKSQIQRGIYPSRLPSTRYLAGELGVSRTTVSAVFDQLAAEGYIELQQGARAKVTGGLVTARDRQAGSDPSQVASDISRLPPLSRTGERIRQTTIDLKYQLAPVRFDFSYGDIAREQFPTARWKQSLHAALSVATLKYEYQNPAGLPALRTALQGYLWRSRGLICAPEQIIVTSGTQQALDLVARLFLDSSRQVALEDPCYKMARNLFAASQASIIPIPVDEHGLTLDSLDTLIANVLYLTPSHQFPLGGTLPAERRIRLIEWARQHHSLILEDDYDGEYRYDMKPVSPLFNLSQNDNVIYISSVSKILAPVIRLGFMVVPKPLADIARTAKALLDRQSSVFEQQALSHFITNGHYERHVRQSRKHFSRVRASLLQELKTQLGTDIHIAGTAAGLHVVVWFKHISNANETAFASYLRAHNVGIYPISSLSTNPSGTGEAGFILGYSSITPDLIHPGITQLGTLYRTFISNHNR